MRNKIFMIVSLLAAVFIFNSCLKDDVGVDWTSSLKGKMYAEIYNAGFQALALQPTTDTVTFKFLVNIATDQPPKQDIQVTLGVDTSAMGRYNRLKGVAYGLYPYIKILDSPVTIKAGTRNAYVHVQVWHADLLDACSNFMAPIVIVSATGGVVASDALNQGGRLMALPISNPYAADYHCVGYRQHPTLGIFPVDKTETLSTIDCKTVKVSGFGDYPYDVQIEVTSGTIVVLGTTCYKLNLTIIDPSTGAPVSSGEGQYTTFTGTATQVPIPLSNDVNYYNPVTKTFVLNAYYNSSANRIMYEVLTRL
jgi:Domain of unknown function (DUF1735)